MEQNTAQHREYATDYTERLAELKDENRQLTAQREIQNRSIDDFIVKLNRLKEQDVALKNDYMQGVSIIEKSTCECREETSKLISQIQTNQKNLSEFQIKSFTLAAQTKIQQQVKSMFDCAQFSQRHQKLQEEIQISQQASANLQKYLQELEGSWNKYYDDAVCDMKSRLEEIDVAAMLSLIEQEASDLQTNELLQDEIAALDGLDLASDTDLEHAKFQFKEKHAMFK